jgi:heme A synthase
MYEFIQKFHSGWAYVVILLLVIATLNALMGYLSKKEFTAKDKKIALFALIVTHLQLLIGLILYFVSPNGHQSLSNISDSQARLTALEHPFAAILAIILITIGWSRHKKTLASDLKFKLILIFYGLGLLLLLGRLPWALWF